MSDQRRTEHRERVVRTVGYNTGDGESLPDALDADHIRVHLCANAQYSIEAINRAIAIFNSDPAIGSFCHPTTTNTNLYWPTIRR